MQLAPKHGNHAAHVETPAAPVETVETVETPAAPVAIVPRETLTSPKLEELKSKQLELQTEVVSGKFAAGSTEFVDVMVEMFKIGTDIKTEEANIARIAKEAEIANKRNERIALVDAMLEAYAAVIAINATDASIDDKNLVYAKFKELRAPIDNEMLLRIPSGIASKKAVDGLAPKTTDGGEKGKAIIAYFLEQRANGVPDTQIKKELVANGHAVGTVGAVILAWQRQNGEK